MKNIPTISLSQKTKENLFTLAWREFSCKRVQQSACSYCRAQPKISKENRTFKKEICGKASKEASSSFEVKHFNTLSYYYVQRFFARTLVMTYSIEVIISQPMSLQFSHYHMIKMATKNSFYHLFYLLCAIQLPFQQRVLHLRSCMRGTHCDSKVLKSAIFF